MSSIIYTRRLIKLKKSNGECARCKKKLKSCDYRICEKCTEHLAVSKKNEKSQKPNATYFYNRTLDHSQITKPKLLKAMTEKQISIMELSHETGLSIRTISNLLYLNKNYFKSTKNLINNYFNEEIL